MRFESEFVVERPAEEVFADLADARRMPEWMPEFVSVEKLGDGPIGCGTEFCCKAARRPATWTFTWSEYVPGRRLAWEGDLKTPVQRRGSYTLVRNGGESTTVRVAVEPRPRGPARFIVPLLKAFVGRHVRRDAERLRRWLGGALGGAWLADAAEVFDAVAAALPVAA